MSQNNGYFSNRFLFINNIILKRKSLRRIKNLYYYIDAILLAFFTRKPKKKESNKKKVIVIYNISLGDGVMFITALKHLREIYPNEEYEITIACQKGLHKIYENLGIFDKVIPLNFTDSAVKLKVRVQTMKMLRSEKYDVAIDPIGIEECTTNILMTRATCADEKIGLINVDRKIRCPKRIYTKIYTKIIELNNNKKHLIQQYTEFFSKLANKKFELQFTTFPSQKPKDELPNEYFIIFPSASTEYKRWPMDRFVEIAKRMYNKIHIPLVICGTSADQALNNTFKEQLNDIQIIDMTGKTNILEYIYLLQNAKFIVTNDTGNYHIAAISQTPVAVLSGPYTYHKYLSYDIEGCEKYKKPYIICENMECLNCENRCIYSSKLVKTWPCLDKITVDKAWAKIEKMIDENN